MWWGNQNVWLVWWKRVWIEGLWRQQYFAFLKSCGGKIIVIWSVACAYMYRPFPHFPKWGIASKLHLSLSAIGVSLTKFRSVSLDQGFSWTGSSAEEEEVSKTAMKWMKDIFQSQCCWRDLQSKKFLIQVKGVQYYLCAEFILIYYYGIVAISIILLYN